MFLHTKKRCICYRIMPKRINHIRKIVMTNLHKLQFCNEYDKTSKPVSFLKCTKSLSSTVIQTNTVNKAIFVCHNPVSLWLNIVIVGGRALSLYTINVRESMTVYLRKFSAPGKASINTLSRRIIWIWLTWEYLPHTAT